MICGIFGICDPSSIQQWEQNPLLDFAVSVSENTGELLSDKKEAATRGLKLSVSNYHGRQNVCLFRGSLHKEAHGVNFNRFTFNELCTTIERLHTEYGINPATTALHSLEIEINLNLKYSPKRIIKATIAHKKKPFVPLNRYAPTLGKVAVYDDYEIKLYDKGRQCGIKGANILRFGVKVCKMRYLYGYNIRTLSDLTDLNKVSRLVEILLKAANEILFFDFNTNTEPLTEKQLLKWERFSNPNYWEQLDYKKAYKARQQFLKLSEALKATNYNAQLFKWVCYEWVQHFDPEKQVMFTPIFRTMEAQKQVMFTHFICTVQTSPKPVLGDVKNHTQKTAQKTSSKKRFCISCGRDISGQKKGSRFCSEKLHGKAAKQCRNKASNHTRTQKRISQRNKELKTLKALTKQKPVECTIFVTLKTAKRVRRERVNPEKLKTWDWTKTKRVLHVKVQTGNAQPIELTTMRAKTYIRHLQGFEILKHLKLIQQ